MPVSMITTPEGEKYRVEHPEGATQEEILARIRGSATEQAPAIQPAATDMADMRQQMGAGNTLQFGYPGLTPTWDTGIGIPQGLTEGLAGMGRRFSEIGTLGTHETPPEAAALLDDSGYATAGGIGADLSTLALGGGLFKTAGMGNSLAARMLTNPQTFMQATLGGAAYGGLTSNNRAEGALYGGIGGGIGQGLATTLGKAVAPEMDAGVRSMLDQGIPLTPGQILGGSAQRTEDAFTSMPVMGDAIKSGQLNAMKAYNKSVINDALGFVGSRLDDATPAGREAISEAHGIIGKTYDDVLGNMNVTMDNQFMSEMGSLRQLVQKLPELQRTRFDNLINDTVFNAFDNPNKLLLGPTFKEAAQKLRHEAQRHIKNSDPVMEDLGNALRTAHKSLLDLGGRQNPVLGARLSDADKAYAKISRIDEAAGYVGARDGVFSPAHMLQAIRKNTSGRQYAAGEGFDQKATEAAKGILSQTVPDSGTAIRSLVNVGLMGGAGLYNPAAGAALAGVYGMYTKPGMKIAEGLLAQRPEFAGPLRKGIEKSAPYLGLLGIGAGLNRE